MAVTEVIRLQSIVCAGAHLSGLRLKKQQALRSAAQGLRPLNHRRHAVARRAVDYADSSCGLACLDRPPLLPIRDI